ncbi:hypothetical protein, partial [Klebsiella pneumoniae]|uniref:hypothetical protein n=1 Tax=Klebsiella pneumoniae TaxID=573 RepID=UPI004055620B
GASELISPELVSGAELGSGLISPELVSGAELGSGLSELDESAIFLISEELPLFFFDSVITHSVK